MGFFGKIAAGLKKTRETLSGAIDSMLSAFTKVDEDLLEELEEILICADVGVNAAEEIIEELRDRIKDGRLKEKDQVLDTLKEILGDMIGEHQPLKLETTPSVVLVIGVNGAGKTTSIGKISKRLRLAGKKVVVAAADTFRAAAIDQLEVWCNRAKVDIVKQSEGSDPAAVVFDAINYAKKKEADVLIIDTAGRLHNKTNLMNELAKINRVIDRELPDASVETLLVLDATTGQNGLIQAKTFKETAGLSGIVLTKMDGTAKGGIDHVSPILVGDVAKELDLCNTRVIDEDVNTAKLLDGGLDCSGSRGCIREVGTHRDSSRLGCKCFCTCVACAVKKGNIVPSLAKGAHTNRANAARAARY